ncbi:MAG: hypothetical protein ACK4GT_10500 [Pararhodobacter sp.]
MTHEIRHPKFGVPVRIAMADGSVVTGMVFVRQGQRVVDVLCDARSFLPVKANDGVRLLNKQHAVQIQLMTMEEIFEKRELFPGVDVNYLRSNPW